MRSSSTPIALVALLAAGAALVALRGPARHTPPRPLSVEARLAEGWITRAGSPPVADEIEIEHDRRPGLRLRSPGAWSVPFRLPGRGRLRLAWQVAPPEARVSLLLRLHRARRSESIREERHGGGRGWSELEVSLEGDRAERAELELVLTGEPADVALSTPALLAAGARGPAPLVLFYLIDCLRADHVGAYGYPRPTTPHLDALARDGVLFEDVWACASWTKPAVGCLFTSRTGPGHGARTLDDALDPDLPTLATVFSAAGYATAAFVANPFVSARAFGLARGFDRVQLAADSRARRNINALEADAVHLHRALVPWLAARAGQRAMVYAHSLDLHAEYRPRPPFTRLFVPPAGPARDLDLYDTELRANDHWLGELLAWLRKRGLYDEALIVVTADHGEEFGESGTWRHGRSLGQALLRVPLVIKLPGGAHRGRRVSAPVSSLDLAPTLLDLAGLSRPAGFEGLSQRPLIEGRAGPPARTFFAEQLSPKEMLYAARDARYKAVQQFLPRPSRRLFDLRADPAEKHDLSEAAPLAARALLRELDAWIAAGQQGYHVAFAPAREPAEVRLEARLAGPGALADVQRFAVELGETLELSADKRELRYRFRLGERARHVVLRTEPADARVRLDLFRGARPFDGAEVRLGAAGAPLERLPLEARAEALGVAPAAVGRLLEKVTSGVRVFHLGARARAPASLDPQLRESLRALGYLH